jgi:hypothetical protein
MNQQILIRFDTQLDEANRLAQNLDDFMQEEYNQKLTRIKDDKNTQDFGATIAIILGTPAAIALAKGLADWLRRQAGKTLTIEDKSGKYSGTNLTSRDIETMFKTLKG